MPHTNRTRLLIWLLLCTVGGLAGCATGAPRPTAQLCSISAVAGCVTGAEQREQQSATVANEALKRYKFCALTVWEKHEYASLLPHTAYSKTGQPTKAQLKDGNRPSWADVKLLATAYNDATPCRSQVLGSLLTARPDMVPILVDTFAKTRVATILLTQRKMTWGESARRSQKRMADLQWAVAAADRRWVAELNASHQAETTQRGVAATALLQYSDGR
jgi:hypothetical protein